MRAHLATFALFLGLLGCDSQVPGGVNGVCATPGYHHVAFEELVLNLPRYSGGDIIVDGYVKAGPRRCRDEASCNCNAEAFLHDGIQREHPNNAILLGPSGSGERFAECHPDEGCNMTCTPGPTEPIRVVGTLAPVVEEEGEVLLMVERACPL